VEKVELIFQGQKYEFSKGLKVEEVVKTLNTEKQKVVGISLNGKLLDFTNTIDENGEIELITLEDDRATEFYRHTLSHVMAQAVLRIFGEKVKLGIGPTIENGFYYDFDIPDGIKDEDLPKIEEEMRKIIKENLKVERFELPKEEAVKFMKEKGQDYKVEIINEIPDEKVSFYKQGDFVDLCRGPHAPTTGMVKHFKLLSVSGAYWRGDERNPMLYRIYGTAFATKEKLDEYLKFLEEAKNRDHRKLGPKLGLFFINTEVASGMPIFPPKGMAVFNELMAFSREMHKKYGFNEVMTPMIMNQQLWKQSGHWDHYKENMYFTEKENVGYAVKPMNCPGHILIYKSSTVSYRDLPIRLFEFGRVHRYERSGVLHGLMRVRSFIQDDSHTFCREDQIEDEVIRIVNLINDLYKVFGFEYRATLSTMPEDHMGDEKTWEKATNALKKVLDDIKLPYDIAEGEGAFYGPKVDFHIKDVLGREWQCGTIQLDFLMPERFELTYVGPDNQEYRPVMIHTAKYGSLERFFGILIENFSGAFPLWIAPVQVKILPIADRHVDYSNEVAKKLSDEGIRAEVDDRQRKTGYKIREAQLEKIPYMLIVGDREMEENKVAVRLRSGKDLGAMVVDELMEVLKREIREKLRSSPLE
jgi:threonyl-tRNA synthetase